MDKSLIPKSEWVGSLDILTILYPTRLNIFWISLFGEINICLVYFVYLVYLVDQVYLVCSSTLTSHFSFFLLHLLPTPYCLISAFRLQPLTSVVASPQP